MAEKSPNAFRTISEVSDVLDVPAHVLRFWESRFTQIKPIKRGGGRRYYRPTDVELIRGIRTLLYVDGMTIKGAQKVLREKGVRHVMELGTDADGAEMAPAKAAKASESAANPVVNTAENDAPDTAATETEPAASAKSNVIQMDPEPATPPALEPKVVFDPVPEPAEAEASNSYGAEFAFEAVEVGFMNETRDQTGDIAPVKPTQSDEIDAIAAQTPAHDATPDATSVPEEDTTKKLRDIVGKMERLRDSMRSQ